MKRRREERPPWLDPRGRRVKDIPHRAVYRREKNGSYSALCCDQAVIPCGGWIVHKEALNDSVDHG